MKNILSKDKGFTLIELMAVLVIVAIFAAIAIPSYQNYVRVAQASQAQQEVQRIASELTKWKSRNFNYLGFNLPAKAIQGGYPATSFDIRDAAVGNPQLTSATATGQTWVLRVLHTDGSNYSFLMNSSGVKCKNKTKANITFTTCGTGAEVWE